MKYELNSIYTEECIKGMGEIPDNYFDMTFADPPFNLGKKYNGYSDDKEKNEYLEWCAKWISEMVRITKKEGSILVHNIPKWLTFYTKPLNNLAVFRHWIAWDAPTAPMGKSLQPNHYGILFYTKTKKSYKNNTIKK